MQIAKLAQVLPLIALPVTLQALILFYHSPTLVYPPVILVISYLMDSALNATPLVRPVLYLKTIVYHVFQVICMEVHVFQIALQDTLFKTVNVFLVETHQTVLLAPPRILISALNVNLVCI